MYNTDVSKIKPNTNLIGRNVVYFETIDSTNTVAKQGDYKNGTVKLLVKSQPDLKKIKKAVSSGTTSLVEVIVEPRANVYPMIPAGKHVSEMYFK